MDEKFAGILDRLQRFYNKTKKGLERTFRKPKKNLRGTIEFRGAKKRAAEAIMNAGGEFQPMVRVWFPPDTQSLKVPNVGQMIVQKDGHAMKPIKVDNKRELKYVSQLRGKKGLWQKLKSLFSSPKGKMLTDEKRFLRIDNRSAQAIESGGGEVKKSVFIKFPAGTELIDLEGQELISLPDGIVLSVDRGIGPDSMISFEGRTKKKPPEEEEEQPPGSLPPPGQPPANEDPPGAAPI